MKPKNRWPDAHLTLKRLYEERVPEGMSQEEFGATFGIGSQGMVWQYLSGHRPLNIEAAAKFATGLRCTIQDISPQMAETLKDEVLPVLGRVMRRAAAFVIIAIVPQLLTYPSSTAEAIFSPNSLGCVLCKIYTAIKNLCRRLAATRFAYGF